MTTDPYRLVVVSAGVSDPSSTRLLADRVAQVMWQYVLLMHRKQSVN